MVPKHILLTNDEKQAIISMYGIKKLNQFPKILKSDPVVRMLKAKSGDLIKILRKDDVAKGSIYYRVVVEG